jgi:ribosome modulation factor
MDMTGHNSNELTAAERKALLMHHMRAISAQQAICDRENEERKRLRKLAKADGIPMADIDYGMRVLEIEDPQIIIDEQRRHSELAEWFGVPIFTQSEFDFDREPAVDRARREGAAAGAMGRDNNPPYGTGSAQAEAWRAGWREEQDRMIADMESAMEKRNRARAQSAAGLDPTKPEGENAAFEEQGGEDVSQADADSEWEAAAPTSSPPTAPKRGRPKKAVIVGGDVEA